MFQFEEKMFEHLSSLESAITILLSKQYPLAQKDILEKIEEMTGEKYSVAGVQRALSSLLERGFLHKHSKYYQLRTDRLLDEKKRVQSVLDRYIEAEGYHLFLKKEVRYYAETLSQLDFLWNAIIEQWFNFYPEKAHAFWQRQPVPWFPLLHSDEERRIINTISAHCSECRTYSVDAPVSHQMTPIYTESPNSSLRFLPSTDHLEHAFSVYGDHIIETNHPPHIAAVLRELAHSAASSLSFQNITALSAPGSYEIIITKDAQKADRYRTALLREAGEA